MSRAVWEEGKECGGTRFLQKAGFPRSPSGKNSCMAGVKVGVGATGESPLLTVLESRARRTKRGSRVVLLSLYAI